MTQDTYGKPSPHLSCIHKQLKIKVSLEETACGSIKLTSCKSFKISHARKKMWNYKFPHVSTVMWPSPKTHVFMDDLVEDEVVVCSLRAWRSTRSMLYDNIIV
jgi:hypothetical protein